MTYTAAELNQTGIYVIINRDTGKAYIGSTSQSFRKRWNTHKSDLRKGKHHSPRLQNAWNKYTEFRFEFKILEVVPKEEWVDNKYLLDIEQIYLDTYQPEYNICKIANSLLGTKRSEEARLKMSVAQKGRVQSEDTKKRRSETLKNIGHKPSVECTYKATQTRLGVPRSEETKAKLRQSNLGKTLSKESRDKISKVWEVTSPDGKSEVVKNLAEFCREHNLDASCMRGVGNNRYKQYKNWKCRLIEDL